MEPATTSTSEAAAATSVPPTAAPRNLPEDTKNVSSFSYPNKTCSHFSK
jgi:hypothetical protein